MEHTSNTPEQWLDIPGYEGIYQASNRGRVRGVDRVLPDGRKWRGRVLKTSPDGGGYLQVGLSLSGTVSRKHVHSLIALTFMGARPVGMEVRHLNGTNTDNRAVNLSYGSRSENMRDAVRHGTHGEVRKTHCIRGHEFVESNLTANVKRRGNRGCKACSRAHGYVRYHTQLKPHFQRISDSYYGQIVGKK